MAGRGLNRQAVLDLVAVAHQQRLARFHHQQHAVREAAVLAAGAIGNRFRALPVGIFGLVKQIARVGKGRHPAAVDQPRVPADMVHMQVRTEHEIHRLRRHARRRQPFEQRRLHMVPGLGRGPRLVRADAGIDQDGVTRAANDVAVQAHHEAPAGRIEMPRHQPVGLPGQGLFARVRQQEGRKEARPLRLDGAADADVAQMQWCHAVLSNSSSKALASIRSGVSKPSVNQP